MTKFNYINSRNNYTNNQNTNSGTTQRSSNYSNYNKDNKGKDPKQSGFSSKLTSYLSWLSTNKAGNPICYKCGKIGLAQECPCHPYKPRVFALGVNDKSIEADTGSQELEQEKESEIIPEDNVTQEELGPGRDEDHYVIDPYDPGHFKILDEYDDSQEAQDEPLRFHMLSIIDFNDKNYDVKLALAKQLEHLLTEEEKLVKFSNNHSSLLKSDNIVRSKKMYSMTQGTAEPLAPNKVLKQSPPILDAKLRLFVMVQPPFMYSAHPWLPPTPSTSTLPLLYSNSEVYLCNLYNYIAPTLRLTMDQYQTHSDLVPMPRAAIYVYTLSTFVLFA